jgi:dUTP pyrophosphatase
MIESNLTTNLMFDINPFKMDVMFPMCKPTRATDGASCLDVVAREVEVVYKDDNHASEILYVQYKLGIKTQLPLGWEGIIRPRSSISKMDLIMCNSPATIDSDYRGEWMVRFKVVTNQRNINIYKVGDRVAQITFAPVYVISFDYTSDLNDSVRNDGGFGSTGK